MANDFPFSVIDLGRIAYAPALEAQRAWHERVVAMREDAAAGGGGESLAHEARAGVVLLVEHDPPVITVTKRPGVAEHLLASREALAAMGVEVHETDRGGDITYHGPGQLVAYPIVDLNALGLNLHAYMRLLEEAVIRVCAEFGVRAMRDPSATGVWTAVRDEHGADAPGAKVCALGVRVRRWVTMHGLALNVTTNLDHFGLIVPCGLAGRPVTSLERERRAQGDSAPAMADVKSRLVAAVSDLMTTGQSARMQEPA